MLFIWWLYSWDSDHSITSRESPWLKSYLNISSFATWWWKFFLSSILCGLHFNLLYMLTAEGGNKWLSPLPILLKHILSLVKLLVLVFLSVKSLLFHHLFSCIQVLTLFWPFIFLFNSRFIWKFFFCTHLKYLSCFT